MKNVVIDIDNIEPIPNNEHSTTFDFEISPFNKENAYLETEDDLSEKVIKYIEREVRSSFEYRKYIDYLKNELDLTKCAIMPGIDIKTGAASLEFHHYPINLYEITEIIANQKIKTLKTDESVSCFDIAEQVMEEHYRGNVGLVPLTKTMHEMAHNRSIIVPIDKVNGNYKRFISKYSSYIPDEIKDRITDAELNSTSDDALLFNAAKLEKNISNFNIIYIENGDENG